MNRKFVYTAEDAAGCIVETADFTQCQDCIFEYADVDKDGKRRHWDCQKYANKPDTILFNGKPCPYKAAKF